MDKEKELKLDVPKKSRFTSSEIAEVSGVSVDYVKKVRSGNVPANSDTAKRILAIDNLLHSSAHRLLEDIAKVLDQEKSTTA